MGPKLKSKKNDGIKETPDKCSDVETKKGKANREDKSESVSKKSKRKIGGKKRIGKKDPPKLDAFRLLMDSRKKVIGDNANGKEIVSSDDNADAYHQKKLRSQRKLFLEKWAENKGGTKKKELDAVYADRINDQLKKRKKRLTNMLLNKVKDNKGEEFVTSDNCKVIDTISLSSDLNDAISVPKINDESKKIRRKVTNKKYEEDDVFLSKLSPSLKGKNMLRYFKKLNVVDDMIAVSKTCLKQKVAKKNKVKDQQDEFKVVKKLIKPDIDAAISTKTSKRIRKKVVYVESDSDSDVIAKDEITVPKKKSTKKPSVDVNKENKLNQFNKIVSPIKIVNIKSSDTIKCVKSPKTAKNVVKEPPEKKIKIAPLFLKTAHKPMICPAVIEARQKFLYSESPKMIEKPMEVIQNYMDIVWFPEISHIQQIPTSNDNIWNLPLLSDYNNSVDDTLEVDNEIKYEYFKRNGVKDLNNLQSDKTICQIFDFFKYKSTKEGLQQMKITSPNFPIYKYFRLMRDKCLQRNVDCQDKSVLWTEKYKPLCTDDIIGNRKSINALKNWLLSWKECTKQAFGKFDIKKRRSSSSDDFFTSDSGSEDAIKLPNNVKIIVGPSGSGKTSTIYAIANELDLNVLEVNASSKRTGKRITTVLQEATQSHKVLTKNNSEDLSVVTKQKRKKPLKKKNSEDTSQNNDNKMSLMLIEDADIVFEEDDGFESALVQIIQTTKRPIIIVVTNLKCHSIKRIIGNNNVIKFSRLPGKFIGPWLDIMIFLESGLFVPQMSSHIIDSNACDMRKSILQVQFLISNYKNSNLLESKELKKEIDTNIEEISDNNDSNMSWNGNDTPDNESKFNKKLDLFNSFEQFSKTGIWLNINKLHEHVLYTVNNSELKHNVNDSKKLDSISDIMDGLSMMDMMQSKNRNQSKSKISSWKSDTCDSLSISENNHEYNRYKCVSSLWCQSLIDMSYLNINKMYNHKSYDMHSILHSDERWITKQHAVYRDLSGAASLMGELDRSGLALDYVSTLRNICRSEKHRCDTNVKRNNRFYHYFRSLDADARDTTLDEACDIIKPT